MIVIIFDQESKKARIALGHLLTVLSGRPVIYLPGFFKDSPFAIMINIEGDMEAGAEMERICADLPYEVKARVGVSATPTLFFPFSVSVES